MIEWQQYYDAFLSQNDPEAELDSIIHRDIKNGITPINLILEGLVPALDKIGRNFSSGVLFLPELMYSGQLMKKIVFKLKEGFNISSNTTIGTLLLGTVAGDLHDIGKNLVGMVAEGSGFKVIDIGIDVSPENFVAAIYKHLPDIVGLSALLTTTMLQMEKTVGLIKSSHFKDPVSIIVGGAPVTEAFAEKIGADAFGRDAVDGVIKAKKLMALRTSNNLMKGGE
jgi:5-methyltetrahydrofolate--homocysteine methyltransferase